MKTKRTFVSLFSGAGIFDLGIEKAGFKPILSIDFDFDACKSIELNSNHKVINSRIEDVDPYELLNESKDLSDLDLIVGGPPCQPYSKSKYGVKGNTSGRSDIRFNSLQYYFKFVRVLQPKVFIIENVPQFVTGKNADVKTYINNALKYIKQKTGTQYSYKIFKFNCSHYGVPQVRERVLIIGTSEKTDINFPEITHFDQYGDKELGLLPLITSGDAIKDLNRKFCNLKQLKPTGKWSELLKTIPPGENYLWHTSRRGGKNLFKWRSRYWNFLLKLDPKKPSWTITANPGHMTGPFHWSGRRLHVNELKRLQTVPIEYKLFGSQRSQIKQIGNAVPSLIGEIIGKHVRKKILLDRVNTKELKLEILSSQYSEQKRFSQSVL